MVFDLLVGARASPGARGESFDTETLLGRGRVSEFLWVVVVLVVFLGLPAGFCILPA